MKNLKIVSTLGVASSSVFALIVKVAFIAIFSVSVVQANAQVTVTTPVIDCPAGYTCTTIPETNPGGGSTDSGTVVTPPTIPTPVPTTDATAKVTSSKVEIVYDFLRKETQIKGTFTVAVQGGTKGIFVYKIGSGYGFFDQKGVYSNTNAQGDQGLNPTSFASSTIDKWGRTLYYVPAGKTISFTDIRTNDPKQMFAGSYYGRLLSLWVNNLPTDTDTSYTSFNLEVPTNKTLPVTIVGEKSPYVSSITPTAKPLEIITIRGERLSGTTLYIDGVASKVLILIARDGKSASFIAPKIASGQHYLTLNDRDTGMSNQARFTITNGTVTSTGSSAEVSPGNLALVYNSTGKEVSLSAPFVVTVTAGSNDIRFEQGPIGVSYTGKGGTSQNIPTTVMYINKENASFPYNLKAGQKAQFYVIATANPLQMFAGMYSFSVNGVYATKNNGTESEPITIQVNSTNVVTVVGEVSPYIATVTSPIKVGDMMMATGVRLSKSIVYIDGTERDPVGAKVSTDGTQFSFTLPQLAVGQHYMQLKDSVTGSSNVMYFQVNSGTVVTPYPLTLTSPTSGQTWSTGAEQVIRWSMPSTQDPHIPRVIVVLTRADGTNPINITTQQDGFFPYLGSYPIGSDFAGVKAVVPTGTVAGSYKVVLMGADSTPTNLNDNQVMSEPVTVNVNPPTSTTPVYIDVSTTGPRDGYQFFTYTVSSAQPFNWIDFKFDCNASQIEISTKGGANCGETLSNGFTQTTSYSMDVGFKSKYAGATKVNFLATARLNSGVIGTSVVSVVVQPSQTAAPSITSISPVSVAQNQQFTIYGSNFLPIVPGSITSSAVIFSQTPNIVSNGNGGFVSVENVAPISVSADGTKIIAQVPSDLKGDYYVFIDNIVNGGHTRLDSNTSKITITSSKELSNNIRITKVERRADLPYVFDLVVCVDGNQSVYEQTGRKYFPEGYRIVNSKGVAYEYNSGSASQGNDGLEDMKNGMCKDLAFLIQPQHQAIFDSVQKVTFIGDPLNVIKETNEDDNSITYTVPTSGSASLSVSTSNPPASTVLASSGAANNEVDSVSMLAFGIKPQVNSTLRNLNVKVSATGSGNVQTAYLFNGSTMLASADVSNGIASFKSIDWDIPANVTKEFVIKTNIRSVGTEGLNVSATINSSDVTLVDLKGNPVTIATAFISGNVIKFVNGASTRASVTVQSPNGGESLVVGSTVNITWTSANLKQPNVRIGIIDARSGVNKGGDIVVTSNTGSYSWTIPSKIGDIDFASNVGGSYRIAVSSENIVTGDFAADASDQAFSINPSKTPVSLPPTINGIVAPTTLKVGEVGSWAITGTDPQGGTLGYVIDWGDNVCIAGTRCAPIVVTLTQATTATKPSPQSATFTHSFTTAGMYTVRISVQNVVGLTSDTTTVVKVIAPIDEIRATSSKQTSSVWDAIKQVMGF